MGGAERKKATAGRPGLKNGAGHLSDFEVCRHNDSLTSMGRPHCGLPPVRATRSARTGAPANATSPIFYLRHRPVLTAAKLNGILRICGRRAVPGAAFDWAVMLTIENGAACGRFYKDSAAYLLAAAHYRSAPCTLRSALSMDTGQFQWAGS